MNYTYSTLSRMTFLRSRMRSSTSSWKFFLPAPRCWSGMHQSY